MARTDPEVFDIKPFIGARDYGLSRDFYVAMGWTLNFDAGDLCELQLGNHRLYLQNYYHRAWCRNTMLHITVDDTNAWYKRALEILASDNYGAAKVRAPTKQDYGALVTFVWDPSGVLLHFAQLLQPPPDR